MVPTEALRHSARHLSHIANLYPAPITLTLILILLLNPKLIRFDFDTESYVMKNWEIVDAPRFPHRELLLDSVRHFQPLATVKGVLESMAYAKLNTLHWHLSDSQAFPFIAPSHPEMAQKAAWSLNERYTSADVADIVAYAEALGIRVVVEIDTPGHTASWCASHPEVCPPKPWAGDPVLMPNTNVTFELIEAHLSLSLFNLA